MAGVSSTLLLILAFLTGSNARASDNPSAGAIAVISALQATAMPDPSGSSPFPLPASTDCSPQALHAVADVIQATVVPSVSVAIRAADQIKVCGWADQKQDRAKLAAALSARNIGEDQTTLILKMASGLISANAYRKASSALTASAIQPGPFDITMTAIPLDLAVGYCLPSATATCVRPFLASVLPAKVKLDAASSIAYGSLFPARSQLDLATVSSEDLASAASLVVSSGFPVDPAYLSRLSGSHGRALADQSERFYAARYNLKGI